MIHRREIPFGGITIPANRPYLIAEAGVNHENELQTALKMVDEAAAAGADAIKFQSYKAESLASRHSPAYWDLEKESTRSQYELFKKHDLFGDREYEVLAERAAAKGITFLSTPFDEHFADILESLIPFYKVASADITNTPFLRYLASKGKPMVLSVGASTIGEVDDAVRAVLDVCEAPLALLHCVLSYPTDPRQSNLGTIVHLQRVFPNLTIGYSDHVPPLHNCLTLTVAWMLGARILEKHFTLDKNLPGNDHYHAMDPADIRTFREQCDFATALYGQETKDVRLCETDARKQARRSLVAARSLPSDHVMASEDIAIKRPGTGIAPNFKGLIVGCKTLRAMEEDEILKWDVFLKKKSITNE